MEIDHKPTLTVERPTGPRLTASAPQSLGQLAISKAGKVSKSIAGHAVTIAAATFAVLTKYKFATSIGATAITGIATHLIVASMMMGMVGDKVPTNNLSCAEATTFLARTSGLNANETTATTNLICGGVADGWITGNLGTTGCGAPLDGLYILATNTTTTAKLNVCGTAFTATYTGPTESGQFQADFGYTGDGSTMLLDTGYNVNSHGATCGNGSAGCNYVQNGASIGAFINNNRTTPNTTAIGGVYNVSAETALSPNFTGFGIIGEVNGGTYPNVANGTSQGHYMITRTSSTAVTIYKNGASVASSGADSSSSAPVFTMYFFAENGSAVKGFTTDQMAIVYVGGSINSTVAAQMDSRIQTYMTAPGIAGH